jgi:hypothetical protein
LPAISTTSFAPRPRAPGDRLAAVDDLDDRVAVERAVGDLVDDLLRDPRRAGCRW